MAVIWGKNHALWSNQGLLVLQLATGTSPRDACSWHPQMWCQQDSGRATLGPFFPVVQERWPVFPVLWHPQGLPLVQASSGCLGGGSAAKGGGAHHVPGCVPDLVVLVAEDAKVAWPRENKYLHIHVDSQNDLLSFEL